MAASGEDNLIRIFDLEGGWECFTLAAHENGLLDRILGVAFRPDGRLVSAGSDGTLRVWNPETGRLEQTFRIIGETGRACFSVDGQRLAIMAGSTIRCWDTTTGVELWSRENGPNALRGMAFLSDGRLIERVREGWQSRPEGR